MAFICLASSRKPGGRCVAGVFDKDASEWLRPIGDRPSNAVSMNEQRFQNGDDVDVLDVVALHLIDRVPMGHQTENHRFDSTQRWEFRGRVTWDELYELESAPAHLWDDESPSSTSGTRDRTHSEVAANLADSLRLILVDDLSLRVFVKGAGYPEARVSVYGTFSYLGTAYSLPVSDPIVEADYLERPVGTYPIGEVFLTVSLAEEHSDGYCYKMIAAVIDRERAEGG